MQIASHPVVWLLLILQQTFCVRGMLAITHPDALPGLDWGCQECLQICLQMEGRFDGACKYTL